MSTRTLSRRARNTLLTVHIAASVALLGDVLALVAVTIRAADAHDPAAADAAYETMNMFSFVFGIPLSFTALLTGVALGVGTRWGIFRHRWVTAKLALILLVILAGALVIGPAETILLDDTTTTSGADAALRRILGAGLLQIAALLTATGLSVFKPGTATATANRRGLPTSEPATSGDQHTAGTDLHDDRTRPVPPRGSGRAPVGARAVTVVVFGALVGLTVTPSGAAPAESPDAGRPQRPWALVRTDAGWVRGVAADDHLRFSGIPYAAPPVGERRWAPPGPVTPWRGVRDASVPAPICPQMMSGDEGRVVAGAEDCLYLNVTVPRRGRSSPGGGRLPVVVWLHGGAFISGAGSYYDGARLATGGDVIVVTVNYRLGALGFLSSPALDATGHPSGNYGLEDQAAALRWARHNAARFGGDPHNVTVAGQSSGARSICAHLASPASAGLFAKAVSQSGPCTDLVTKPVADQRGNRVATEVGCAPAPPSAVVACLRGRPVADLLDTLADVGNRVTGDYAEQPWQPVVGTPTLPHQPLDALAAGSAAGVPLLTGVNRDDIRPFVRRAFPTLDPAGYRSVVEDTFGPDAAAVLARYPAESYPTPTLALATLLGDQGRWLGACTVLDTAEAAAAHADVFAYELLEDSGLVFGGFPFGAYHNWDLEFLFDTSVPGSQNPALTPAQTALSTTMIRQWSRFAATGEPNGRGLPEWPEHGRTGAVLGLAAGDGGIAPTPSTHTHQCDFWSTVDRAGG